ncbi:tenascin-R-like [Asterias rubens]|uniref:tenascin-R-like n=1 Tax=Asterias rubens TaxID=7604 RepID=UPI00145584D3|nr:tenascin-R-like [Asterias rubens]
MSSCIELPPATINARTDSSFKITWSEAPNPTYSIKQYDLRLQHPPGSTIIRVLIGAAAGASRTFQNLNAAEEYGVRLDAVLIGDISVDLNIFTTVWTLPHSPTDAVLQLTGDNSATLTWTRAQGPVDYYELTVTTAGRAGMVFPIPSTSSKFVLENLTSGTQFGFQLVSVVNTPNYPSHHVVKSASAEITFVQIERPPQPTGFTIQVFRQSVMECKWNATNGDFDNYLLVFAIADGSEITVIDSQVIAKTTTIYSYTITDLAVNSVVLYTQKGGTKSIVSLPLQLPSVAVNIKLPHASIRRKTSSSFEITWSDPPNPADNIKQYKVTLEHPLGTPSRGVLVDAEAGASHTFEELNAAEEYGVRVDAVLQGDATVQLNIVATLWTLPHAPSDAVLQISSNSTALLTWTSSEGPVDFYEFTISQDGVPDRIYQIDKTESSYSLNRIRSGMRYGFHLVSVVFTQNDSSPVVKSQSAEITFVMQDECGFYNPCVHGVCRLEDNTKTCDCEGTAFSGELCESRGSMTMSDVMIVLAGVITLLLIKT